MCWTNTLPHQWLLYVVNSYCLDEELLLLFFTVFKSWIPKLSFSVKITWSILLFRCFFMASAIWFWMSIFEGQNLLLVIAGIWCPEKRTSFINTSNKVFICGTLVILFSQTIFLIWSFNLWSMEWSKLADWKIQNALKAHDYRSHSPFIIIIWQEKSSSSYPDNVSILSYDRRSHHPATRIMFL